MLDAEDASQSRHSNRLRQHTIVRPVTDNNLANRKVFGNGDEGVDSPGKQSRKSAFSQGKDDVIVVVKPLGDEEAKTKLVGSNDEKLKEKSVDKEVERAFVSGGKEEHGGDDKHAKNEENMDSDDSFIGPGSPSFRDYCIDYDSGDRSSVGDFNDCDSGESTKNGSEFDLSYHMFMSPSTFFCFLAQIARLVKTKEENFIFILDYDSCLSGQ